jgi:hypothetical protein
MNTEMTGFLQALRGSATLRDEALAVLSDPEALATVARAHGYALCAEDLLAESGVGSHRGPADSELERLVGGAMSADNTVFPACGWPPTVLYSGCRP